MAKDAYTVFIVDDDTKTLTMMKHYLEKNSEYRLNIHTFATGEDALNKLDLNPEVVILDYYFNGIDQGAKNGMEVLKKVKEKKPDTGIVMLSGQDSMEVALGTIREGAYDYIIKNDSAVMRTQITTDKILHNRNREHLLNEYKKGLRITIIIMIIFIIAMIGFVIYAST